jgi:anthranilate phosphoribosyltransferase
MLPALIEKLIRHEDLTSDEAAAAMTEVMEGRAADAQIAALLVGLAMKGERPAEIVGLAHTMRAHAVKLSRSYAPVFDTCGTGGDRSGTFNISSCAAVVVAACGVRVAKHGNRAASSKCGSADVLEALGARIDLGGEQVAKVIEGCGFGFLFAQRFNPAMRHVGGPRREIAVRTMFNILGPLSNPANPRAQLVGVGSRAIGPVVAEALGLRGAGRAMVVHSNDGLDEFSTAMPTHVWMVGEGAVMEQDISPQDFGLGSHALSEVAGDEAAANAGDIHAVLDGAEGPKTDFVVMNAAAALYIAGAAPDFGAGVAKARESIASGRAREVLDHYVALTQEVGGG